MGASYTKESMAADLRQFAMCAASQRSEEDSEVVLWDLYDALDDMMAEIATVIKRETPSLLGQGRG